MAEQFTLTDNHIQAAERMRVGKYYREALSALKGEWLLLSPEFVSSLPPEQQVLFLQALRIGWGCSFSLAKQTINADDALLAYWEVKRLCDRLALFSKIAQANRLPGYDFEGEMVRDIYRYYLEIAEILNYQKVHARIASKYEAAAHQETEATARHLMFLECAMAQSREDTLAFLVSLDEACYIKRNWERIITMSCRVIWWAILHGKPKMARAARDIYLRRAFHFGFAESAAIFRSERKKAILRGPRNLMLRAIWFINRENVRMLFSD